MDERTRVLCEVHEDPWAIAYAGKYQADREVVLLAAEKNAECFRFANLSLGQDTEFVVAAAKIDMHLVFDIFYHHFAPPVRQAFEAQAYITQGYSYGTDIPTLRRLEALLEAERAAELYASLASQRRPNPDKVVPAVPPQKARARL